MNAIVDTLPLCLPGVLVMGPLTVGSGFFSGSETALFYLSRDELRRMRTGSAAERTASRLLQNPDRLLTAVLFWNLVINVAYFAVSLVTAKRLVTGGHSSLGGVLSLLSLCSIILLGEVIPKSLAVSLRYPVAVIAAWPLAVAVRILDPILPWLELTTSAVRRVFWPQLRPEPYLQTEDLERALETSELGFELAHLEQSILQRVLDLSEMTAEELMRPRNTLKLWLAPVHLADVQSDLSRLDFLYLRDEDDETIHAAVPVRNLSHFPEKHLEKLAEPVIYFPWCGTLSDVLTQLRTRLSTVAVVVNEYGEMIGVITESDILDTLLNPESSRARRLLNREPIQSTSDGKIQVHGLTTLRYLARHLGIDFEAGDDGLLTVSGLLHEELQRFPLVGDKCRWEGYELHVIEAAALGRDVRIELDPSQRLPVPEEAE